MNRWDKEAGLMLLAGLIAYFGRAYAVVIHDWFYYFFTDDFSIMVIMLGYVVAVARKKTATKWIVLFYAIVHFFTLFDDYYDKYHPNRTPQVLPIRYLNAAGILVVVIGAAWLYKKWHERNPNAS